MTRTFGKYRSRRKKPAKEDVEEVEQVPAAKKAPKPKKAKKAPKKKVLEDTDTDTDTDYDTEEEEVGGGLGIVPHGLHVKTLHPNLLAKTISVMDDHEFGGLKSAAKYILGEGTNKIFHHRHRATQHKKHFESIARSTRQQLAQKVGDKSVHRAVHEAMHSASLGGGFHFDHAIHIARHIHQPIGGGLSFDSALSGVKVLSKLNPLDSFKDAKSNYDKIDLHDWSARGMAKNALHAYSGNFHAAAGKMKADSALAAMTGVGAPEGAVLQGAAQGMGAVGSGLGYVARTI